MLIHDETIDGEGRQPGWREWLTAAGVSDVDSERGPRFNNAVLAVRRRSTARAWRWPCVRWSRPIWLPGG